MTNAKACLLELYFSVKIDWLFQLIVLGCIHS